MKNKSFQQELKEKVKERVKPSDLKKGKETVTKTNSKSSIPSAPPLPKLEPKKVHLETNRLIQFKANSQLLFSVRENELDWAKMTIKYEGNHEYNFQSGITDLTFTELVPLKTIDLVFNQQKLKELIILSDKPVIDFTCFNCDQEKTDQTSQVYIDGLGVNPHQLQTICPECILRVNILRKETEF